MSEYEMDFDDESDEDTETQIKELEQLRAVLQSDEQDSVISYPDAAATTAESCPSITSGPIATQMTDDLSKIEMALALNKFTDEKLQRLEKLLISRLQECKTKLNALQVSEIAEPFEKSNQFRYGCCGKPYFKDKNLYPAPPNDDTILMMKSEMFDFATLPSVPGWTVKDKSDFINLILKMSQNIKAKELNSQISHLRRQASSKKIGEDVIDMEVEKVRKQIEVLNKKTLKDLALPVDQEYDWETIANKLNQRHSAHEYRALWKLFLHPSISKNSWSKNEHVLLQKLAHAHKMQDWDAIAKELNTGRTGYQCFVYFRTNMASTASGQKWSKEEEEYLKRLVDFYREDNYIPWGRVAASMENRTKVQIYNKYMRVEEQRKGRFIPEEDAVILTAVDHFGIENDFRRLQQFLPGRSVTQLRNRYQVLCKNRVSTVWSVEDDKKLVQLLANQDQNMSNYASVREFFPGKDRAQLRARHKTLLKWMKHYPNLDLSYAPRRGSRRLGHGKATTDLNKALENLKKKIQSEVKEKKSKTMNELSSEQEIEDAIVATLVTEALKTEQHRIDETIYDEDNEGEEIEESRVTQCNPTCNSNNKTNLQKLLMLLRCTLNKERFKQSSDYKNYFGVDDVRKGAVKVKCYSRKNNVRTINCGLDPDLWGNNKLNNIDCVLPPHLATITGCRKIMSFVKEHADPTLNIFFHNNKKKYKQEYSVLMERFNVLFLWPILLSNENPSKYIEQMKRPIETFPELAKKPVCTFNLQRKRSKVPLPAPAITIPPAADYTSSPSSNVIDLPADEDDKNKNTVTLTNNFEVEFVE